MSRLAPALLLVAAASFAGCDMQFSFHATHRSGPWNDDYVGEPLSDAVKRYEHALDVCNDFVRRLKKGEYAAIDAQLFGPPLHADMGERGLEELDKDTLARFGAMKSYKPLQWGFATNVVDGRKVLYSVKIVEYERGKARFTFVLDDDGKYEKLIGLRRSAWKGPASPGEF
jgi:hypothetical protein